MCIRFSPSSPSFVLVFFFSLTKLSIAQYTACIGFLACFTLLFTLLWFNPSCGVSGVCSLTGNLLRFAILLFITCQNYRDIIVYSPFHQRCQHFITRWDKFSIACIMIYSIYVIIDNCLLKWDFGWHVIRTHWYSEFDGSLNPPLISFDIGIYSINNNIKPLKFCI